MKDHFKKKYIETMYNQLLPLYPDVDNKKLLKICLNEYNKHLKPMNARIVNEYRHRYTNTDVLSIFNMLVEKKPVITGNGALFDSNIDNLAAKLILFFMNSRKKYKKTMFQYDENDRLYKKYDGLQRVWKEFTNSYYGVLGLRGSVLNDFTIANAVTMTGQTVITTVIIGIESMFGNILYMSFTDIIIYINKYSIADEKILTFMNNDEISNITYDRVIEHFKLAYRGDSELFYKVEDLIRSLSNTQLINLYYRNNFYEFIKLSAINKLIINILKDDISEVNKFIKKEESPALKSLEMLWKLIDRYVVSYSFKRNRYELANEILLKRNIVHTDTDSVFVYLNMYYQIYKPYENKDVGGRYSILGSLIYIVSKYLSKLLYTLTETMNVPSDYRHYINMKNEFVIDRIIMTENKKNYISLISSREGKLLAKPNIDIKGMSFKKSAVNVGVTEEISSIINNYILLPEVIDVPLVLQKILSIKNKIVEDIMGGSLKYASNATLKGLAEYVNPYTQAVVKGSIVWNAICDDNDRIEFGDSVRIYKIVANMKKLEIFNKSELPDNIKKVITETIFDNEHLSTYGFEYIAIPRTCSITPEWVRPFIDTQKATDKVMSHFTKIIMSMGIEVVQVNNVNQLTNIIEV